MPERLYVLVELAEYGIPVLLDRREMPADLAEALNQGYRDRGIVYRWQVCAEA